MVSFLTDNGIARGFTLSTQSMSPKVLTTIKRNNMGVSDFSNMLEKCNQNNIQTYTELILGLPNETLDSWITGLCDLLTHGQHSNIEIWLCQLLVNAELSGPESRAEFGIDSVYIGDYMSGTEDPINEGVEIVVGTNTMPRTDLVDGYMFGWLISNFHCFGWTQIASRWLNASGISYYDFYVNFWQFVLDDEFLGEVFFGVREKLCDIFTNGVVSGNGLHVLMAGSQKILHAEWNQTWRSVERFIETHYSIDPTVMEFAKAFVTAPDSPERKLITSDMPVWQTINNICYDGQAPFKYEFTNSNYTTDIDRYYDGCYFQRRKGWGKYSVGVIHEEI